MSASLSHSKTLDTPPSSDLDTTPRLPPSPPQSPKPKPPPSTVDRLLRTLHLHRAGRLSNQSQEVADWRTSYLTRTQFAELEGRVREEGLRGWWEEKQRYDWEPASGEGAAGRLVLRMPSAVHEQFTEGVKLVLRDGIAELAGRLEGKEHDEEAGKTAAKPREVRQGGSTTLYMHPPKVENSSQETVESGDGEGQVVRRSPDASFRHPDSDMPGLVVEVSYSQQRKDLPRLAESYIIDSQHRIRCVIGLDLPYVSTRSKGDKSATISVWRAATERSQDGEEVGICKQDMEATRFRDEDGKNCDSYLELSIADLLPFADKTHLTEEETLRIPFLKLASILADAEKKPTSSTTSSKAPTRFRKRKRTPEEELDDEREKKYLQQEETELARDGRADGEWGASRRRAGGDIAVERRRSARMVARKKSAEAG